MHRRGVQVLDARLGLVSNNGELIRRPEYFTAQVQQSLLTDYHAIEEIPYGPDLDAEILILDEKEAPPRLLLGEDRVVAVGDFTALEASVLDRRYTLFGNLGFLYRYIIYALEKHHRTYTFHASAMLDEATGESWLISGPAGAGKSCLLLAGLTRGFTVFSTEMTHLRLGDGGYRFYKGSLFDNVRVGNLTHDFPGAARGAAPPGGRRLGHQDRPGPVAGPDRAGRPGEPRPSVAPKTAWRDSPDAADAQQEREPRGDGGPESVGRGLHASGEGAGGEAAGHRLDHGLRQGTRPPPDGRLDGSGGHH